MPQPTPPSSPHHHSNSYESTRHIDSRQLEFIQSAEEEMECLVCLDSYKEGTGLRYLQLDACKHHFCRSCYDALKVSHREKGIPLACPGCKILATYE